MTDQDRQVWKQLKFEQKAIAIAVALVVVLPPTIVTVFDLPPASWLKLQESKILGGYYLPKTTWALLTVSYSFTLFILVWILATVVRSLTGKTIVQLFSKKPAPELRVELENLSEKGTDAYADFLVAKEWLNAAKQVSVGTPDGRLLKVKLNADIRPGTHLRLKGQAEGGGDLYLFVRVLDQALI
jgi:hypothetical protein